MCLDSVQHTCTVCELQTKLGIIIIPNEIWSVFFGGMYSCKIFKIFLTPYVMLQLEIGDEGQLGEASLGPRLSPDSF